MASLNEIGMGIGDFALNLLEREEANPQPVSRKAPVRGNVPDIENVQVLQEDVDAVLSNSFGVRRDTPPKVNLQEERRKHFLTSYITDLERPLQGASVLLTLLEERPMSLVSVIKNLNDEEHQLDEKKSSRYPNGRGGYKRKEKSVSRKSKVPVYDTIKKALSQTKPGSIFSTKGSYRLYVTTAGGWGSSKQQRVSGRTAKGFTPGSSTPGSDWSSIKSHAARTAVKHGGSKAKSLTAKARREKDQPNKYKAKAKRRK